MFNFLKRDKERIFWKWFVKNKSRVEIFIQSDFSDYSTYKELSRKMKNYNSNLFPEITMTETNKFVLIITPDGNEVGIKPTENLFDSRPKIENWIIEKYRQPCDEIELNFEGINYSLNDIEVIPKFKDDGKVDLNVFVKNIDRNKSKYENLAHLYFDHVLGEYNSMTKIECVNFHDLDQNKSNEKRIGLLELRKMMERNLP